MTAPDDVRARFEAIFSQPPFDLPMPRWGGSYRTGQYQDYNTQCAWEGYRAAHAAHSGEVRELVDAARVVERRLIPLLSGTLRDIDHADFIAFFTALAKFTRQEKP